MSEIKLNIGSGNKKSEGWLNVDGLEWDGNTDFVHNITEVPYDFVKPNTVDEISCIEVLEHIGFKEVNKVIKEWFNILKPGGKVKIQVPDCGSMMEMYVNNEVCDCVPHKTDQSVLVKANPSCFCCQGRGKVNSTRWLLAFTGAQKHKFDTHLNIFTKDSMRYLLTSFKFENINVVNDTNKWKIIATATKPYELN